MKTWTKMYLDQIGVGSNIDQYHSSSRDICTLLALIHMKSLPNIKLSQVGVGANMAQNQSSILWEVISGHYSHDELTNI